ncbi:MAG: sensor domain-containing diguanylate cyclase [Pseudomonadota bacterium]
MSLETSREALHGGMGVLVALLLWLFSPLLEPAGMNIHAAPNGTFPQAYLVDVTGGHGLDEVMSLSPVAWKPVGAGGVSFGYDTAAYWFMWKYRAGNDPAGTDLMVEIAYPMLDEIDLFAVRRTEKEWVVLGQWRMGDTLQFDARPFPYSNFVVPFRAAPDSETQFVMRVRSTSAMQVPVTMWGEAEFAKYVALNHLAIGAFLGAVASLLLYHFAIWITLRERMYVYLMIWMVFGAAMVMTLNGLAFQHLWPTSPRWNDHALVAFLILASMGGVAFSLETTRAALDRSGVLARSEVPVLTAMGVALGVALLVPYRYGIAITMLIGFFSLVYSILVGLTAVRAGYRPARVYLAGRIGAMLAVGVIVLGKFSILSSSVMADSILMLAVGLDLVTTSLALAPRLSEERAMRTQAQHALDEEKVSSKRQLESRIAEQTRRLLEENRELSRLSLTDALTGLPNRRALTEAFAREAARAKAAGQPLSIALLDVDYFKRFNDTHGHAAGDQCLRVVAREIRQHLPRTGDLAVRWGGEEFCLLLPNTQLEGALIVAERVRLAIQAARVDWGRAEASVTVSFGVHTLTDWTQPVDLDAAMVVVDRALYRAKSSGRNKVVAATEVA